jgi:hypothetical protein
MTRWQRDLSKIPGVVSVEHPNATHLRLTLTNGSTITASVTPSCRFALAHVCADVRRALGATRIAPTPTTVKRRRHRIVLRREPIRVERRPPTPQPRQDYVEILKRIRDQMEDRS